MIRVSISIKSSSGALVRKGHLEYHGVKRKRPDGSTEVELDEHGQPVREEIVFRPPGIVSARTAVKIGFALASGADDGTTDDVEWAVIT
jgi:hypothetical protein